VLPMEVSYELETIARTDAVLRPGAGEVLHTPTGVNDVTASTLQIGGRTADAAINAIVVRAGDTVLTGGAAGGVGVFAVQLARRAGARVIGTASAAAADFLRALGVEPVTYGDGLADRVRALARHGAVTAALDLVGTETARAALELGVSPDRIATIAAGGQQPAGVRATGGREATPGALDRIAAAIAAGEFVVPVEATFPIEQTRAAVELQRAGHAHGKVVITLDRG
jgi:NADPH:quinone reductase-like Zn-dependent oxidoreductase